MREATYNKGLKEREIENLQEALEDTDVRAPISGRVMSVKNTENTGASSGYGDDTSGSDAYITIMDMTTYQVKGTINELNVGTLSEGMNVLIRSRLDESVTWSGVLESIDWETKVQTNNSPYYGGGGGNEMTSSSKYPFYVKLNDVTGLILGQHVYIEPDYGQQEVREGLWLPEYYIVDADSSPYVWAANGRDRLEKRGVSLGEYDAERGEYQVISGLKENDYIAFPMDSLTAGMHTQVYEDNSGYVSGGNSGGFGSGAAPMPPTLVSDGDASDGDAPIEAPDESLFGDPAEIETPVEDAVVPETAPAEDAAANAEGSVA